MADDHTAVHRADVPAVVGVVPVVAHQEEIVPVDGELRFRKGLQQIRKPGFGAFIGRSLIGDLRSLVGKDHILSLGILAEEPGAPDVPGVSVQQDPVIPVALLQGQFVALLWHHIGFHLV